LRRLATLRRLAAAILAMSLGCRSDVEPFPTGAVRLSVPSQYAFWWRLTEACSGLTGDLSQIQWYTIPNVASFYLNSDTAYNGAWFPNGNRIVLADSSVNNGQAIRHEMLHALSRMTSHPADLFLTKCGGIVACSNIPCASAAPPAASAPILDASLFPVSVAVTPSIDADSGNAGWFVVTVSVKNPSAQPVRLHYAIDSAGDPYPVTFGVYSWPPLFSPDFIEPVDTNSLVGFAVGEVKRWTFDLNLGATPAKPKGTYAITGFFNGDSSAAVSFIVP